MEAGRYLGAEICWPTADSSRVASALGGLSLEIASACQFCEPEFPPAWQACIPWISGLSRKPPPLRRSVCGHPNQFRSLSVCSLMSTKQYSSRIPIGRSRLSLKLNSRLIATSFYCRRSSYDSCTIVPFILAAYYQTPTSLGSPTCPVPVVPG